MPSYSATHTRQAIIDLLQGDMGTTAKLTAGLFKYGVFKGQPEQAQQANALQTSTGRHWFDVQIGALTTNESSPMSGQSNRRVCNVPIRIDITTHVATTAQGNQRKADLAAIEQDCGRAIRALHFPGNLTTDDNGGATGIVSGLLLGAGGCPVWEKGEEDWPKSLVHSRIEANAIVEVIQAEDPDTIYGSDLEAWYRSDDGTFTQNVVTQIDDKTSNANNLTVTGSPVYIPAGNELNYTPDVSLDGVDDFGKKASAFTLGTQDCTIWLLTRADTWANGYRMLMLNTAADTTKYILLNMLTGSDRWGWHIVGSSSASATTTTGVNDGNYHLLRLHVDSTTADTIGIGVDGGTPTTAAWTGTNPTLDVCRLGVGVSESSFCDMTFKECWVVGAVSTSAQDAKALDYFRVRYGLAI